MISIRIKKLTKRFGAVPALRELDLSIGPGELFFLLGPSGGGKTTLLRTLAGFHRPDEGRVLFGEEDVTELPPHRRATGMMFQSYALWPHLTVAGNVAFGLEERRMPKEKIRVRVAEALESVHMAAQADRHPHELSGGQQQRVALARALVIRPRCLLLDEPLSNLDAKLRVDLREEIRRVCREFELTTVYVTHDQKEALAMADRIAVLDHGSLLQIGTPRDVYRRPHSRTVAQFLGETDFIEGVVAAVSDRTVAVDTPVGRFEGVAGDPSVRMSVGQAVTLSIRPECWTLSRESSMANSVRGRIGEAVFLGDVAHYEFASNGVTLKVCEMNPRFLDTRGDDQICARVAPDDVVVLAS